MAESNLSLGYGDIASEVGRFLGFGRDTGNHSTDQTNDIDAAINSGYRRFLRERDWNFMKTNGTITTVASTQEYDLPDGFGNMLSPIYFPTDSYYNPIVSVTQGEIDRMDAQDSDDGVPEFYAIRSKSYDGTSGQRYEIRFYPTPQSVWTLKYQYSQLVNKLTTSNPYPLGGQVHAETIMAACMAAAERMMDDERNIRESYYREMLAKSIESDCRLTPDYFGYNGDDSDDAGIMEERTYYITLNGSLPS